jgi:ABC-type multidrug transport system ATPase subunit
LSAGERRRLSIAEEIVHKPSICIVDEPVKQLPIQETVLIMNSLGAMVSQNRTVVVSLTEVCNLIKVFTIISLVFDLF